MSNRLAETILNALKIREESYDYVKAEEAKGIIDYNQFYTKSLYESADKAAKNFGLDESMTQPIYLLIKYNWYDIQEWAKRVIKR